MASRKSGLTLLAPVDAPDEIPALARAGATAVYGGVQPAGWPGRALSATQRTFPSAHLQDEDALAGAIRAARQHGLAFHLVLNAPVYPPGRVGDLVSLAARAAAWGATGVIAADLELLRALDRAGTGLAVTLSTLGAFLNREAVGLYRAYGLSTVVLPRHLTVSETASLVAAHPDLAFEAFVLVGRCPNDEALCTFQHTAPDKRWPCELWYRLTAPGGEELAPDHPFVRWHRSWEAADRRLACGLCAVKALKGAGVRGFKVVGRGGPTRAKVDNVRLVAGFLGGEHGPGDGPAAYRARFGRPCHPLTCYYPELFPAQQDAEKPHPWGA